jgi:hypothetical protein
LAFAALSRSPPKFAVSRGHPLAGAELVGGRLDIEQRLQVSTLSSCLGGINNANATAASAVAGRQACLGDYLADVPLVIRVVGHISLTSANVVSIRLPVFATPLLAELGDTVPTKDR